MDFTRLDMVKTVIEEVTPIYETLADNADIYPAKNKRVMDKAINKAFKGLIRRINFFTVRQESRRRKRELRRLKRKNPPEPEVITPTETTALEVIQ